MWTRSPSATTKWPWIIFLIACEQGVSNADSSTWEAKAHEQENTALSSPDGMNISQCRELQRSCLLVGWHHSVPNGTQYSARHKAPRPGAKSSQKRTVVHTAAPVPEVLPWPLVKGYCNYTCLWLLRHQHYHWRQASKHPIGSYRSPC